MRCLRPALLVFTVLASARCASRPAAPPPNGRDWLAAERFADSLLALAGSDTHAAALSDETVVAAGYFERLRMGLGSPFRLAERALEDPRLPVAVRRRVARALLVRMERGQSYEVPRAALDGLAPPPDERARRAAWTSAHMALIDSAVYGARDPRAGELAVRIAYALAAAEGVLPKGAPYMAAEVAALRRDRALAIADARRLRRAATARGVDPVALIRPWRAARHFEVERPPLMFQSAAVEPEAVALASALRGRLVALDNRGPGPARDSLDPPPLLGHTAALRWSRMVRAHNPPPRAAVIVALRAHRQSAVATGGAPRRAAWNRLLRRARDEESLAAEHILAAASAGAHPELARALVGTAVAMRAFAQEPVFPLAGQPYTSRTLQRSHGLQAVTFDADVPAAWRSHYLWALDGALTDARRVLPGLDLRRLRVRVGRTPLGSAVLAAHQPRTRGRTLYLPPSTAGGTVAHELGHDIDSRASVSGVYVTDRAVRRGETRTAAAIGRLSPGTRLDPGLGGWAAMSRRPTELFARGFDWFLAAALAAQGRSNGYLSAAQDELLSGYALAVPPDPTGATAGALVELLERMTNLPDSVRRAFVRGYGFGRPLTSYDWTRLVLRVPAPRPADFVSAVRSTPGAALLSRGVVGGASAPFGCTRGERAGLAGARCTAARLAATARARGVVKEWARSRGTAADPIHLRALRGGPWDPRIARELEKVVRDTLLARACRAGRQSTRADCDSLERAWGGRGEKQEGSLQPSTPFFPLPSSASPDRNPI